MLSNHSTPSKIFAITIQLVLGLAFLISGLSKLPTLETFGWTIAETGWFNWAVSEWIARFIIGLELFIGLLFITQLGIKKIARSIAFITILFFSTYLFYVLNKYGNEANCGCYGELIPMTTKESLVKNLVLFLLLVLNTRFSFEFTFKLKKAVQLIILALCLTAPFLYLLPDSIYIMPKEQTIDEPINRDIIYKFSKDSITHDKMILAIVSPGCKYCRKAANRMRVMKERHPELPFLFAFGGSGDGIEDFFKDTKAQKIPYILIDNKEEFVELNGRNAVPTIKWIEGDKCVRKSNYYSLKESQIIEWLSQ